MHSVYIDITMCMGSYYAPLIQKNAIYQLDTDI